jgi:hypothetical protein
MAREIPEAVRAAAGLAATVLDEARRLPETLPGLPVRVLSLAMQLSMKLQQHYAGLVARGDELLTGLHGDQEPGLATFDEDLPAAPGGQEPSPFDRVAEAVIAVVEDDDVVDVVEGAVDDEADGNVAEEAPEEFAPAEAVLDDLAIEELVDETPDAAEIADASGRDEDVLAETDVDTAAEATSDGGTVSGAGADTGTGTGTGTGTATDVATEVDVLTPDGDIETVEARVTDEGVAAPESAGTADDAAAGAASGTGPAVDTATDEGGTPVAAATGVGTAADTDADTGGDETDDAIAEGAAVGAVDDGSASRADGAEGGSEPPEPTQPTEPAGPRAPAAAPVEGYDSWSIAQLRGHLRGYQAVTVSDLLAYEEATRAREPYLRMLRNRLEKLDEQAVEASPLAPRGT